MDRFEAKQTIRATRPGSQSLSSTLKSVELFAGAGGLALGTHAAGFRHVALIEWDNNACDTMRANKRRGLGMLRGTEIVKGDVREYDFRSHRGEVDLVSGGPPCQPFSIGGKHRGFEDARNMFPEAVRAVREIQPKAFLFENVKGLTRSSFSNYFNYIIQHLRYPNLRRKGDEEWTDHLARLEKYHTSGKYRGLQYNVVPQLLNAANFGVPQRRERILIVGVRADLGIHFSFPLATHEEDALLFEQWVSGDYWERHRVPKSKRPSMPGRLERRVGRLRSLFPTAFLRPWRTVRDAISDLPRITEGEACIHTPNHYLNPGARVYAGHDGSPFDTPAKTLKAGDHGVPGGENMLRFDDGRVRYFSVRECARLQTFPDSWVFEGSWTESMRQLGNAVPVRLVEIVARDLRRDIDRAEHVSAVIRAVDNQRSAPRSRRQSA